MRKLYWTAALLIAALFPLALLAGTVGSAAEDGKKVFTASRCQTCHSVEAAGIEALAKSEKMKGPDLTNLHSRLDAEWIAKYLRKKEQLDGKAHRTEFKGSDEELQALVDWLLEQKSE
jgi:mono/diheme cytochrome c family protein